jgi:hypothetical protein
MFRMTYMRSWKSHRLTSHTWLGLNPQIGRPLSRIVGAIGLFKHLIENICICFSSHFILKKSDRLFHPPCRYYVLIIGIYIFFFFQIVIYTKNKFARISVNLKKRRHNVVLIVIFEPVFFFNIKQLFVLFSWLFQDSSNCIQ